ncbi:hypothetical protein BRC90_11725 [Halobacteriales archaeon QS_4_69_34]|nr:MAG: hypothetical protein BRC90_11725 [Halobacteriales archaeon QS_4_69_34]
MVGSFGVALALRWSVLALGCWVASLLFYRRAEALPWRAGVVKLSAGFAYLWLTGALVPFVTPARPALHEAIGGLVVSGLIVFFAFAVGATLLGPGSPFTGRGRKTDPESATAPPERTTTDPAVEADGGKAHDGEAHGSEAQDGAPPSRPRDVGVGRGADAASRTDAGRP